MSTLAPYSQLSIRGFARKLALLLVLFGLFPSSAASAQSLVCEGTQSGASAQISSIAPFGRLLSTATIEPFLAKSKNKALACGEQNLDDCDMELPSGQAPLPSPHMTMRPNAALVAGGDSLAPHCGRLLFHAEVPGRTLAGHDSGLFRPPQA